MTPGDERLIAARKRLVKFIKLIARECCLTSFCLRFSFLHFCSLDCCLCTAAIAQVTTLCLLGICWPWLRAQGTFVAAGIAIGPCSATIYVCYISTPPSSKPR